MTLNLLRWSHFACFASVGLATCVLPSPSRWMEEFWDHLQDKQITGVMMPGSHNSGNTNELASNGKCQPVYDGFKSQIQAAAGGLRSLVTDALLLQYFQPWNVNQNVGITAQMAEHGVRWLHLKVCNNLGENPVNGPFNLSEVYHTHGGYTSMSLANIFQEILAFLTSHPKEIVLVGLNDFYQMENRSQFSSAVVDLLAQLTPGTALGTLGGPRLIRQVDWSKTMEELVEDNRRLAVFIPDATEEEILPSAHFLTENYDPAVFQSDDFAAIQRWLENDARAYASQGKFYALQGHPAKDASSISVTTLANTGMLELQRQWFQVFPAFVEQLLENNQSLILNGISSDFVDESGVFSLAMRLQGFCRASTSTTVTVTRVTTSSAGWISSFADDARPGLSFLLGFAWSVLM